MQPTQLILNTAYVDAEQMQQTVWYWRRQQAGQLQTDLPEAPAPPEMFDGPTVARADAAFLARYGRAPVAQEFLTAYRLILENIQRDPEFYASTIHRANLPATPLFLSILPGTAKPRRTVSANQDRGTVAMVMLGAIFVMIGGAICLVVTPTTISPATIICMGIAGLAISAVAMLMGQSATIGYLCPECGKKLNGVEVARCDRCYLEFAQLVTTGTPALLFQPVAVSRPEQLQFGSIENNQV